MELLAEFQETIVELNVTEGERVQAGQLLMRQDGARVEQDLKAAEAAVTRTRQRLAELVRGPREEAIRAARARLDGAREILEVSTREHLRIRDLAEQNIASQTDVDRALRAVEIARTDVEALGAVLGRPAGRGHGRAAGTSRGRGGRSAGPAGTSSDQRRAPRNRGASKRPG